jgi:hypothetical protein
MVSAVAGKPFGIADAPPEESTALPSAAMPMRASLSFMFSSSWLDPKRDGEETVALKCGLAKSVRSFNVNEWLFINQ